MFGEYKMERLSLNAMVYYSLVFSIIINYDTAYTFDYPVVSYKELQGIISLF